MVVFILFGSGSCVGGSRSILDSLGGREIGA